MKNLRKQKLLQKVLIMMMKRHGREAYKSEYEAFCELADEIMNLIKCDRKTANAMIIHKSDNIQALVYRM